MKGVMEKKRKTLSWSWARWFPTIYYYLFHKIALEEKREKNCWSESDRICFDILSLFPSHVPDQYELWDYVHKLTQYFQNVIYYYYYSKLAVVFYFNLSREKPMVLTGIFQKKNKLCINFPKDYKFFGRK